MEALPEWLRVLNSGMFEHILLFLAFEVAADCFAAESGEATSFVFGNPPTIRIFFHLLAAAWQTVLKDPRFPIVLEGPIVQVFYNYVSVFKEDIHQIPLSIVPFCLFVKVFSKSINYFLQIFKL